MLHVPHLVFMRLMPQALTVTPKDGLPLLQQLRNEFFQLCTVERMEKFLFFSGVVSGRTVKSIESSPPRLSQGVPPSSITLSRYRGCPGFGRLFNFTVSSRQCSRMLTV